MRTDPPIPSGGGVNPEPGCLVEIRRAGPKGGVETKPKAKVKHDDHPNIYPENERAP